MSTRTPQTIGDAINKLLLVHYNSKIAIKRNYDSWTLKQIWQDFRRKHMVQMQKLDINAHHEFGSDIAISKFVLSYCSGQVKNEQGRWITKYSDLPNYYTKSFKLTAISACKSKLLSEGIDNFVGLDYLESLDLSDNPNLDDFACDQLSRQFRNCETLKEINLSHNPKISIYGLEILFRIPSLRKIIALETQASNHEDIDLFVLAAEDEKQCEVLVHKDGRKFKLPELEELRSTLDESLKAQQLRLEA